MGKLGRIKEVKLVYEKISLSAFDDRHVIVLIGPDSRVWGSLSTHAVEQLKRQPGDVLRLGEVPEEEEKDEDTPEDEEPTEQPGRAPEEGPDIDEGTGLVGAGRGNYFYCPFCGKMLAGPRRRADHIRREHESFLDKYPKIKAEVEEILHGKDEG